MGIGMWELLIILAIVLVIFGAKKLRNLGGDLGGAIKNFKQAVKEGESEGGEEQRPGDKPKISEKGGRVIDAEVVSNKKHQA
ncbi:preprotein translocase subunit TatA [Sulfurifustis variabilis]|uniref:Sec-independent protein translocase protein TatA n=1 Tax=Sulfurifustis variabilis TaxID=1675686 RepID=A0A1B4V188_9GAMM|nr:twin-arginine translocase TatA/TatE family subunit [Sulfurifustis variabilis]BAU47248.1 preprotein translocase subunit TatA [Sulfurifustis variabilis]